MSEIKVGDELAFCCEYGRKWEIHAVTQVVKNGFKCGPYRVKNNMWVVGADPWRGPHDAHFVTDEIREQVARGKLIASMNARAWDNYTTDQLNRIMEILREPKC